MATTVVVFFPFVSFTILLVILLVLSKKDRDKTCFLKRIVIFCKKLLHSVISTQVFYYQSISRERARDWDRQRKRKEEMQRK